MKLGFDGLYKVGCWTPVWVTLKGGSVATTGNLELTTPDGDGVPVRYTSDFNTVHVKANETITVLRYTRFGRSRNNLQIRWTDDAGQIVTRSFSAGELSPALFSFQRLAVTIGPPLGISEAMNTLGQGESDRLHHVTIENASDLPDQWFGYEGVNLADHTHQSTEVHSNSCDRSK